VPEPRDRERHHWQRYRARGLAGVRQTIPITIAESNADSVRSKPSASRTGEAARIAHHDLGLVLGPITEDIRAKLGLTPQQTGVVVHDVLANGAAADRGISAGSVIMNVHRQSVTSPADVQQSKDAACKENRSFVMVLVRGTQSLRWVVLPLNS
jgi:serine protease Do